MESIIFDWDASRSLEHQSPQLQEESSWAWLALRVLTRLLQTGNLKWQLLSRSKLWTFRASQELRSLPHQLPNRHQNHFHTYACLSILNTTRVTSFVVAHEILVDDMVRVIPALKVRLFVREFTLVKVVEEPIIGHDMVGVEGASHRPICTLTHELWNEYNCLSYYTYGESIPH